MPGLAATLLTALLLGLATPECRGEMASVDRFIGGGLLDGANGLVVGPDGYLYVASVFSPGVFVLDPDDGSVIKHIGPEDGAHSPDDVAFAPDGTLCWTNFYEGTVEWSACTRRDRPW